MISIGIRVPLIRHIAHSRVWLVIFGAGREGCMPTDSECQIMAITINLRDLNLSSEDGQHNKKKNSQIFEGGVGGLNID